MHIIQPTRTTLFVILSLLIACNLTAQPLDGVLKDSITNRPVVYATVHLVDKDNSPLTSSYSNEAGFFSIQYQPAAYHDTLSLLISATGFEEKRIAVLSGKLSGFSSDQPIYLVQANKTLEAITVSGVRRVVEVKPGMIVYHAENDVTNKGGTAADILRKAPVLNVDGQGNVSMRGSSNLKILIDGKYSGQIARSPADALNMMPAEMVKSVEVITTPSAKYDAEGAAGIINIITKKNRKSFSGNLEIAAGNFEQVINPRIATSSEKWSFSLHGHLHRLRYKREQFAERLPVSGGSQLTQNIKSDNAAPHGSADVSLIFTPNEQTEWSLGANLWFGKWPGNARTITRQYQNTTQIEFYRQETTRKENYLGSDIYFGFDRKFKKANRSLTVLAQFTPARSSEPYDFILFDEASLPYYNEINNNHVRNIEWTAQADYLHPFNDKGDYILETGIKAVLRNAENDYSVVTQSGGEGSVVDRDRTDFFKYRQNIGAGYAILKAKWEHNWYAEGGLRYEITDIRGRFTNQPSLINNQFNNFIPSFNLTKKLNQYHMLGLSYTQRITRPYIWDLNPNANASDPKNIETGNPALDPEIMHQAEMTYGLQAGSGLFVNTALFWKRTNNAIIDFSEITDEGIAITRKENMASNTIYGLNLSVSARPASKWSINGNINLNYLNYSNDAWQVFNRGWAGDININNTFKLPYNFIVQAFGEYTSRKVTVQGYDTKRYYYTFALKKEISNPKLSLTIATANPFSKYIAQTKNISAPSFISNTLTHNYLRNFRITASWEFGSNSPKKAAKKIRNDDVNIQGKE